MGDFKKTTIGNLVEFQRGFDLPKSQFNYGKYPVRSSNGVLGYHNEFKTKAPGITIGRSGTVGIPHYIDEDFFPHNTTLFIKDFKGNYPKYIYYLIQNLKLNDWKSGSGVPTLNRNHIHPIKISAYLNKQSQKQIAKVLSDLDAKIEVNNQINAKLEAMAKALYEYWFVQFDFPSPPTHEGGDKEGKPYKSSGGKMVYNEELKREIPEGWEVEIITKSCLIVDCLHSKKPQQVENSPYYLLQLENIIDNGLIDISNKYKVKENDYSKWTSRIEVLENDILITNAGRVAANAQIPKGIKSGIGRNITAIRPKTINPTFLFLSIRGLHIQQQILSNTDVGSFFKSFNVKNIKKIQLLRPPKNIEDKFEKIVRPLRDKREQCQKENQKLAELRDWLLPMLMNGQVSVGEVGEYVNQAAEHKENYNLS